MTMPPLVVLTTIWLAGPVSMVATSVPRWDGTYAVAYYLPGVLGLVAAWGTCRRRPYGRWAATALAILSAVVILRDATRAGTIAPGVALWTVGMPLVVLANLCVCAADFEHERHGEMRFDLLRVADEVVPFETIVC